MYVPLLKVVCNIQMYLPCTGKEPTKIFMNQI